MLKNRFFWLTAIVGLVLDRLTKLWTVNTFSQEGQTIPLIADVFHFTYRLNDGAAWSILRGWWGLPLLSMAVSLGLILLGWFGPRFVRWEQVGYGLILGGALGNGLDRVFNRGLVIDFLDFRWINFPVFNVADICVSVGVFCLLIAVYQTSKGGGEPSAK
jgi:signal peptidase II